MGPALAFAHGKAFGTEIFSQYGIGWPWLVSLLSYFSAMTYSNVFGLEVVYGCIYYIALFFVLRVFFRQEAWACLGVILAMYWQLFWVGGSREVPWFYPSSTMMRHPLDVWFFLVLLICRPADKLLRAALAGLICALGVFFETETGIYLLIVFVFYWILRTEPVSKDHGSRFDMKGFWRPLGVFAGVVAVTLCGLLFYASRGTFFTKEFLLGWMEALVQYGGWGLGAIPIAELPDIPGIIFMSMLMLYLAVIGYAVIKWFYASVSKHEVWLATMAAYGLGLMLLFVGRSVSVNLCHVSVPFAIVLTALIYKGSKLLMPWRWQSSLPFIGIGSLIFLLMITPSYLSYPSVLSSFFTTAPNGGLSLTSNPKDVSGLPAEQEGLIHELNDTVSAIKKLNRDGAEVAVLDGDNGILYYAANLCPWSRYNNLFHMMLTKKMVEDIKHDLIKQAPKWVVIRGQNSTRYQCWEFIWQPLHQIVMNRYRLHQTIGSFEIWEYVNQETMESRARAGDVQAQWQLANRYLAGDGVAANLTNAFQWFSKAAEQGLAEAQCQVGVRYFQGEGVARDYAASIGWFRKAADQGNADALYNLGLLYENGLGVTKDLGEAAAWYQRAGEKGHILAQNSLGLICFNVRKDYVEAEKWFRKAAEQGNALAQNSLGVLYLNGLGVKQDANEALKWFQLSGQSGLAEGQNNCGLVYFRGQRFGDAVQWFHAAAKQGYGPAQLALGQIYHDGQGVKVDNNEAYKWLKLAQLQGVPDADKALTNCTAAMSREQVNAAEIEIKRLQK